MPLTIPDQTVALQAKAPDAMSSLASMLNIAGGAQALKKAQATYGSDVSQRASEASLADSNAQVGKATINPRIEQQAASTDQSQTQAKDARFKLAGDMQDRLNQVSQGLLSDPAISSGDVQQMLPKFLDAKRRAIAAGVPEQMAEVGFAHMITQAMADPGSVPQLLKNSILQSQNAAQQAQTVQPNVVQTDNGQQIVSNNPNIFSPPGTQQPIAPIQKQLPPTTPTMEGSTPGYLGPQPAQGQGGFDPSKISPAQKVAMVADSPEGYANGLEAFYKRGQAQPARVTTGLPVGASGAIEGTQGAINDHWKGAITSSNTAQQDIGVLQNIKQHAAGAATGVAADKQTLVAGIAGMLGMDAGELAKTNADLLAKNSAMLALAGGDTNLARTMAEAATPNSHMTKEAIVQAADQVIAQRKLALARTQFLTPFKAMADQGHPEMYNNALNQFNSVADPRVIQFTSMTPEEKVHLKSSMTEKERSEFGAKLGKARSLGIAQ